MKKCLVCGKDIEDSAIKCVHCDSFQNWRRFFGTSQQVILSLLVALISVTTVAVPILIEELTPQKSAISITYLSSEVHLVSVLAVNTGTRPGVISGAALIIEGKKYTINLIRGPVIIKPGDTVKLVLQTNAVTATYYAALGLASTADGHPTKSSNCEVDLQTVSFRGKKELRKFVEKCVDLLPKQP